MKSKSYKRKNFLRIIQMGILLLIFQSNFSFAQNQFCLFDEAMTAQIESGMEGVLIENELLMQQEMTNNPQAIMNGVVYEIPVVFHVIHLGEVQGIGSNIPASAIATTLQQLNDHYRDVLNVGYDVEFEFCLAKRDDAGNCSSGINRVDGSSISSYSTFGINSANEAEVKALSIWPYGTCINIWSVHHIQSPPGQQVLGFATFPGTSSNLDGIVLRSSVVGSASQSGVVTHEMGHFFDLYHTFQGSNGYTDCPANDDCENDGDMVCDTRSHPYMNQNNNWFPCNESQYTACDPGFTFPFQVVENHMNYTPNNCRDEFSPKQAMRMRCALMTLRPELMYSLCCVACCTSAVADFTASNLLVDIGESVTFINTSTGANQYEWTVEGNAYNSVNLTYQFDNFGTFDVCLSSSNTNCINQKCVTIEVTCDGQPPCDIEVDCNNLIKNGDFSLNCVGMNSSDLAIGSVCNWRVKYFTPRFCTDVNGSDAMVLADWDEAIVTEEHVPLEFGKNYKLSFEYYRINQKVGHKNTELSFGFDFKHGTYEAFPFNDYMEIGTVANSVYDEIGDYSRCFAENEVQFHYYEKKFKYDGGPLPHLYFSYNDFESDRYVQPYNYIHVRNVAIMCCDGISSCTPLPDFTYDIDCPKEFVGSNAGDGDDYVWTFSCDASIHYGPSVTVDLPVGECEVCLTIFCDLETSTTICETVTVPEESIICEDVCTDVDVQLQTCNQDISEENTFVANVELSVPNGTGPCDGISVISNSAYVDIELTSMNTIDDPADPLKDIITLGLLINAPVGYDLLANTIAGNIMLCDEDGKVICFDLTFIGQECDNCLEEITVTATCADDDPSDDVLYYEGSVTFELPIDGGDFEECDPISTETSYSQTVTTSGNTVTVDFDFITEELGFFNTSTLLCFLIDEKQYCITLNIEVSPCPPPVDHCIDWGNKVTDATDCHVVDGGVSYIVIMDDVWLFNTGYGLCDGGLYGSIGGGGSVVVTGSTNGVGDEISYSATITMPCGFDTSIPYELKIYVCDGEGQIICLSFNIRFPDCDEDCDDRGDDKGEGDRRRKVLGRNANLSNGHITMIYPNPVSDLINIEVSKDAVGVHTIELLDQFGKVLKSQTFNNKLQLDLSSFSSGLHLIKILDDQQQLIHSEKLIIMK